MNESKRGLKQVTFAGWIVFLGTMGAALIVYYLLVTCVPHSKIIEELPKERKLNALLLTFVCCMGWIVEFLFLQWLLERQGIPIFRVMWGRVQRPRLVDSGRCPRSMLAFWYPNTTNEAYCR